MDRTWLQRAINLSRKCPASAQAFSVGAILVDADGREIAAGYSRELGEGLHAEEIALARAHDAGCELHGSTLYSSLEPCSVRLSGKTPCVHHIVAAGIRRVVYALREPPIFVQGAGAEALSHHSVEVVHLEELGAQVVEINRHLLDERTLQSRGPSTP